MAHALTNAQFAAEEAADLLSKVPRITIAFWIVKICATTLGETGGDALSMQLNLGYLTSTWIFLGFFVVTLVFQLATRRYHPVAYWAVVVATTTVGTTTSDYLDRTLDLGYPKSSAILFCGVLVVLVLWHFTTGKIRAEHVTHRTDEAFYWLTILVSNTLGTALGDFVADSAGMGFEKGALVFALLIALVGAAYFFTSIAKTILFWAAYVLTRPLGATLGDILTKPHEKGGLDLNRMMASLAIAVLMVVIVMITHRRQGAHAA